MKKQLLLVCSFLLTLALSAQVEKIKSIHSLAAKIDSNAFLLHSEEISQPRQYTSFFIDTVKGQLNKVMVEAFTDKWVLEHYYFNQEKLIMVSVSFRNEDNEAIRDTEDYLYINRKPLLNKYQRFKKSAYKKYLNTADKLLQKSKLYTGR
jgi:hypothetical protein